VNPVDAKIRRGELDAIFPTRFAAIPGPDVAGAIDLVGEASADVAVGDLAVRAETRLARSTHG
jgi:NADPH:quinone reductase-like Zn-dependent oxidoreductase